MGVKGGKWQMEHIIFILQVEDSNFITVVFDPSIILKVLQLQSRSWLCSQSSLLTSFCLVRRNLVRWNSLNTIICCKPASPTKTLRVTEAVSAFEFFFLGVLSSYVHLSTSLSAQLSSTLNNYNHNAAFSRSIFSLFTLSSDASSHIW